jgi:hypothetical protein
MSSPEASGAPRLQRLRAYLGSTPPGPIADPAHLATLLGECWDDFAGGAAQAMAPSKLRGRMEEVTWDPPVVAFTLERRGGAVGGSSRAELQRWRVDTAALRATYAVVGRRSPTLEGRTLPGGLRVLERLGETSEGPLYRAEYPASGVEVALVVLRAGADPAEPPQVAASLARLRDELGRASAIEHPNVAAVRGVDETPEGLAYVVLECLRGELLAEILGERQAFPLAEAVHLSFPSAAG